MSFLLSSPLAPNQLLTESLLHISWVQRTALILHGMDLCPLVHDLAVVWNDTHSEYTSQGKV